MKLQWNKLCESLLSYGDLISKTLELLPQTKQTVKIKKLLAKEWDQISKIFADLDLMIDPMNPIDIEYPFQSERFKAMWKYYKDGLIESHNMILPSRAENSRLMQLYRFSRKDEERAIQMLELFCANQYRNIICPSEKQLSGEEPALIEQKTSNISMSNIPQEI